MEFGYYIKAVADYILFGCCLFILFGAIFLTYKTRFVQIRLLSSLFKMLRSSNAQNPVGNNCHTISPKKALFTAMSTTIGISTIVAPVIAIRLGGPGALIGFLLTSFFGSAATYTEVHLGIRYRERLPHGGIMGGPMQYLKHLLSPSFAKWYAVCCLILMMAWSGAQANQVVAILDSPLLGSFRMPTYVSGSLIAILVMIIFFGGIRRISAFSAKLVPVMFVLYLGSCLWILGCNYDQLGAILNEIVQSAFAPQALANGTVVGGIMSSLRWGIFKGIQTSEAGAGTQAIPHSAAETNDPVAQGALAMFSTYAAGSIAFLSGCVALVTRTWQSQELPLGMTMVAASFQDYFSYFGVAIVAISALLFGFGTILGNCYNGSQCFYYLTNHAKTRYYLLAMALTIFIGSISDVVTVWSLIDIVLACMVVPHMAVLMFYVSKKQLVTA